MATTGEENANEMPGGTDDEGVYPPYPQYATHPAPPSVADTIMAGRDLRVQYKSTPRKSVRKPPKPARPRGPKATDVKMSKRAMRSHARCLRRHGAVLTDRLEHMAKPARRTIIYLWRERAHTLPAETIARLRSMLDADEPFKPDQAYEYFVNLRKTKKKFATVRGENQIKKDMMAIYDDKRFTWARNATVAFARGIQQRLSRAGSYALADGMLRLSNIILEDVCRNINMKPPSRLCTHPKAKFVMEMSDKVAVWIDDILAESDDRMLMMDFDEDVDVTGGDEQGDTGFADNFLKMMGDGQKKQKGPQSAYLNFTGEMLEAFKILTDSMNKKGDEQLLTHGKFIQTYKEAADKLKLTPSFDATQFDTSLADKIKTDLDTATRPDTPQNLAGPMKDVIKITSNYLAQNAEYNKDKGPAFQLLLKEMRKKGGETFFTIGKITRTYTQAGEQLENAKDLRSDHDDPNLSQEIHSKLTKLVEHQTPRDLSADMADAVDKSSKYLSQYALDESQAAFLNFTDKMLKAFLILTDTMYKNGDKQLLTYKKFHQTYIEAADKLRLTPSFEATDFNASLADSIKKDLDTAVKPDTPKSIVQEMQDVIEICSNYLAQNAEYNKDKGPAFHILLKAMDGHGNETLFTKGSFAETNDIAAQQLENAKVLKIEHDDPNLSREINFKLTNLVDHQTPANLATDMAVARDKIFSESEADKTAAAAAAGGVGAGAGAGPKGKLTDGRRERRTPEKEAEAQRRREEEEERRRRGERDTAMQIQQRQLRARSNDVFYKQHPTELTHLQASDWLSVDHPMEIDKSVKEAGDTARLQKKFERKLSTLVSNVTPPEIADTMQDVIIESSRILSECFLTKNYKQLARTNLIFEMQKKGNVILVEVDGAAETHFFAAQRLKKAESLGLAEPCSQVAFNLTKKLEETVRCRPMPRKLTMAMKDHIHDAANYLAVHVTRPDEQIEAYVALLNEMEVAGDALLIEGDISKSYMDSAAYLRQLTTFKDEINLPNSAMQSRTEGKLNELMNTVVPRGYSKSAMTDVIRESSKLLVSYIMLQELKTEALKVLIERMDTVGQNVLLRHSTLRKTYTDGADLLRPKNADQLRVISADPVVARKIQIKLQNLIYSCTPEKYQRVMNDVIEEATLYLAVHFLQPRTIQICKCMKNVCVQCELWCDEILRRVARPCCTCSRHISAQALVDLAEPGQQLLVSPTGSRAYTSGVEISLVPCLNSQQSPVECKRNITPSYCLYSSAYHHRYPYSTNPEKLQADPGKLLSKGVFPSIITSSHLLLDSSEHFGNNNRMQVEKINFLERREQLTIPEELNQDIISSPPDSLNVPNSSLDSFNAPSFFTSPLTMVTETNSQRTPEQSMASTVSPRKLTAVKCGYTARAPIVTTDQMADWHAMMVSLVWNIEAWRSWIQDNMNRAVNYDSYNGNKSQGESWTSFQRRMATEALQWRQYNNFSRQLTLRLALKYRDKKIVSPTRATVKTEAYSEYQKEMLEIIDMFNRWTRWLTTVIKKTDAIPLQVESEPSTTNSQWLYFKKEVENNIEDWNRYNGQLKGSWENKSTISGTSWRESGSVWVMSACGAVPSGAVAAGMYEGEVIWIARTTHRGHVLPAALHPSKHCCIVYSSGSLYHYTKYQVMCNAEVSWAACRAAELAREGNVGGLDTIGDRAVRVAQGVYVGRVHYRGSHLVGAIHAPMYCCHVVIFDRPFAFNCYELLILSQNHK